LTNAFGDALSVRMGVASGEVILGRPGSFVTGAPVAAAARLVRLAQPGEVVVGERTATAAAGAFELQQRDSAYVLVGALEPTQSPAQIARRRKRRQLATLAGAVIASAVITLVAVYATRPAGITVPPNSVGIIDPKTNKVVEHVPVGSKPGRVVAGAQGVWVANLDDKTLSRIDPKTRRVVHLIRLDGTPTDLSVGAESVWVAYGYTGALARVAAQFNSVSEPTHVPVNTQLGGLRGSVAFGAGSVWAVYGDSSVFRIDPSSMRVLAHLFAGYAPSATAFGEDSLWVANWEGASLMRVDASTNGVVRTFGAGNRPNGVAVGDGVVWVTDTADNAVARIDPDAFGSTTTPVGRAPMGIAYRAGGVWVANSGDGTVSRIDPRTRKVVATIRVGGSPWGIAVSDEGMVWVTVRST
jgi:serine/threonine-protein kinase